MNKKQVKISKFLSYVLRHKPDAIGLSLDGEGWAFVDELIEAARRHGTELDFDYLKDVVDSNDKKRFSLSEDGKKIRANQGHSIEVDLALEEREPPQFLYHGTATRFWESIKLKGLKPSGRHHVHLSTDYKTAKQVGKRHGMPLVLRIDAKKMFDNGLPFYISENGVWLIEAVSPQYFTIAGEDDE